MLNKIKDWALFIGAILVGLFFASQWASEKKAEKRLDDAMNKINKAGDDIEADTYNDADNAAHAIDNMLGKLKQNE